MFPSSTDGPVRIWCVIKGCSPVFVGRERSITQYTAFPSIGWSGQAGFKFGSGILKMDIPKLHPSGLLALSEVEVTSRLLFVWDVDCPAAHDSWTRVAFSHCALSWLGMTWRRYKPRQIKQKKFFDLTDGTSGVSTLQVGDWWKKERLRWPLTH